MHSRQGRTGELQLFLMVPVLPCDRCNCAVHMVHGMLYAEASCLSVARQCSVKTAECVMLQP